MPDRTALIVGAGIGGLAAGIALRQAGWNVQVFERAAHPRELGFALLIAPNALISLRHLGLADAVLAGGFTPDSAQIFGRGGRLIRVFDTARARAILPEPLVVVLRPVLHEALLAAVGAERVILGSPVTACESRDGRPAVVLQGGRRVAGDLVVGADGIGSVVRRSLRPHEAPPRRTGLGAVRGLAENVAPLTAGLTAAQYWGPGVEVVVARASRTAVYWAFSIPLDRMGESRDPLDIARRVVSQFDDRLRGLVAATRAADARFDELVDRDPIEDWGRGAVTLLGDAAHPMLPNAGQGAAQALEDAVALGRTLSGSEPVEPALRRYEQVRSRRSGKLVIQSRRNARLASVDSALGCWLRETAVRLIPESLFARAYVQFGNPPDV